MNVARILEILRDCHGNVDKFKNPIGGAEIVDVWMEVPLHPDKVKAHEAEMIELLKEWPRESWGQPVPELGKEISYITAGGVLDSQQMAFVFFAFGKILGWWKILDPSTVLKLGKDEPIAATMIGQGMVAIMGYTPSGVAA